MSFGLDAAGFNRMRETDLKAALEAAVVAQFGEVNLEPDSVFSQLIGVVAAQLGLVWEALEAVYHSQYPNSATGIGLDNVAALENLARLPATSTAVQALIQGTEGTLVPAGTRYSIGESGAEFEAQADVTIDRTNAVRVLIRADDVQNSTLYRVRINGADHDYTSDASATAAEISFGLTAAINGGAEPVTAVDHGDGTLTVTADDLETAFDVDVDPQELPGNERLVLDEVWTPQACAAVETGAVLCLTGTLDTIATPVAGLAQVTNLQDGVLGRDLESDAELRLRRLLVLTLGGRATLSSMVSHVLGEVPDVTVVKGFENVDDITDVDGRPPHSVELVVLGGTDQAVGDKIWEVKPAGIQTHGNTTVQVEDTNGDLQDVNFSRPVERFAWVRITKTLNPEEDYPADGDAQIAAKILALGLTHQIGQDVLVQRFIGPCFEVAGIKSVLVEIDLTATAPGPPVYGTTDEAVAATQVAVFDSSRITVI